MLVVWLTGCDGLPLRERAATSTAPVQAMEPATPYTVAMPDVLHIRAAGYEALACVDIDGTLHLDEFGSPYVGGLTVAEARIAIAAALKQPAEGVQVRLAEARAKKLYLYGPDNHRCRVLPYTGALEVREFLQSHGLLNIPLLHRAIVARQNVVQGQPSARFYVDLTRESPVQTTPVLLQPGDAVYLNEPWPTWWSRHRPNWVQAWGTWLARPTPAR